MKTPPLYHISFNNTLPNYMYPRQPAGLYDSTKESNKVSNSLFAENLPPRISFSPSIEHCFKGVYPNIFRMMKKAGKKYVDMYVYYLLKGSPTALLTPKQLTDRNQLWDAFDTLEHCYLSKVRVTKIAKVRITVIGEQPMIHPFNDKGNEAVSGTPPVDIKVIQVYDAAYPLILKL